jgi:hypothetical protein
MRLRFSSGFELYEKAGGSSSSLSLPSIRLLVSETRAKLEYLPGL